MQPAPPAKRSDLGLTKSPFGSSTFHRREFLAGSLGLATLSAAHASDKVMREPGVKLKLGLNAYSFDKQLRGGTMTLNDAIRFCAQNGVDAIDTTGYYFPGYPKAPEDEYIYNLKRVAFVTASLSAARECATTSPSQILRHEKLMCKWSRIGSLSRANLALP